MPIMNAVEWLKGYTHAIIRRPADVVVINEGNNYRVRDLDKGEADELINSLTDLKMPLDASRHMAESEDTYYLKVTFYE